LQYVSRSSRLEPPEGRFFMQRAKIMVIEDNSSDVFLLRRALFAREGENFDLEIVGDGERALQLIHARDDRKELHPSVILLDLHLPKHDGLEILLALRENPALRHIQVVVTTNGASPQEEAELQKMGASYRLKPKDLGEFEKLAADLAAICSGTGVAT